MGTAGRDFEERNHHDNDEQCRICANYVTKKEGVDIFDEEGKRHYLQTNIRKYLYILVSVFFENIIKHVGAFSIRV